jgi:uncharacterized protein DUF5667
MRRENLEEDALQRLLEGSQPRPVATLELEGMARLAGSLRVETLPLPSPIFIETTRARIVEEAERIVQRADRRARWEQALSRLRERWAEQNFAWRRSARVVVALSLAAVMMLSAAAVLAASSRAIPSQALYPVKLFRENAAMWLTRGDEARGFRHLEFARKRVSELHAMAEAGIRDEGLYEATLRRMDDHTLKGTSLVLFVYREKKSSALLARLKSFSEEQSQDLAAQMGLIPPGARDQARDAISVLALIDTRVNDLMAGCNCADAPLELGRLRGSRDGGSAASGSASAGGQQSGRAASGRDGRRTQASGADGSSSDGGQYGPFPTVATGNGGDALDDESEQSIRDALDELGVKPPSSETSLEVGSLPPIKVPPPE